MTQSYRQLVRMYQQMIADLLTEHPERFVDAAGHGATAAEDLQHRRLGSATASAPLHPDGTGTHPDG